MTKLKSAEQLIFEAAYIEDSDKDFFRRHGKLSFQDAVRMIDFARKEAIEAALEVAAKESTKFEYSTPIISPTTLQNKKKILSLINHPNLKL